VIRGGLRDVLDALEGVSVVYADPPYTRVITAGFTTYSKPSRKEIPSLST